MVAAENILHTRHSALKQHFFSPFLELVDGIPAIRTENILREEHLLLEAVQQREVQVLQGMLLQYVSNGGLTEVVLRLGMHKHYLANHNDDLEAVTYWTELALTANSKA